MNWWNIVAGTTPLPGTPPVASPLPLPPQPLPLPPAPGPDIARETIPIPHVRGIPLCDNGIPPSQGGSITYRTSAEFAALSATEQAGKRSVGYMHAHPLQGSFESVVREAREVKESQSCKGDNFCCPACLDCWKAQLVFISKFVIGRRTWKRALHCVRIKSCAAGLLDPSKIQTKEPNVATYTGAASANGVGRIYIFEGNQQEDAIAVLGATTKYRSGIVALSSGVSNPQAFDLQENGSLD